MYDPKGNPIPFIVVKVYTGGKLEDSIYTNKSGVFNTTLEPGTYDVTASSPEYGKITATHIEVAADASTSIDLNFQIKEVMKDHVARKKKWYDRLFKRKRNSN